MWPMLLDMTKLECKKDLRKLELEAYSTIVSTFRAQGNLNSKKTQLLKELEHVLKISTDRHKAELRRANNDEKLYTIAKRLSHGECVSSEWLQQSRRLIPLLPRLQQNSNSSTSSYYRILADHILNTAQPILKLYPEPDDTKLTESDLDEEQVKSSLNKQSLSNKRKKLNSLRNNLEYSGGKYPRVKSNIKVAKKDQDIYYLSNGYAVSSKCVELENLKPSEFVKKNELSNDSFSNANGSSSFLKYLIQKYKNQNQETSPSIKDSPPVKSTNSSPIQEHSSITPTISENPPKKSSSSESTKSGSASGSTSSNKNSKLISQIIEANATKAVQQQQQQQNQQLQAHQQSKHQAKQQAQQQVQQQQQQQQQQVHQHTQKQQAQQSQVQQQQNKQNTPQQQFFSHSNHQSSQSKSSPSQQIVLQQLKPMQQAFSLQGEVVSTQLISNSNIILDSNNPEKINETLPGTLSSASNITSSINPPPLSPQATSASSSSSIVPTNTNNTGTSVSHTSNFLSNPQLISSPTNIKPPTAIKISSTQILRLNSSSSGSMIQPNSPLTSQPAVSKPVNQPSGGLCPQSGQMTQSNNANSSSTIVKLTPSPQININSLINKNQFNNSNSCSNQLSTTNQIINPITPVSVNSLNISNNNGNSPNNSPFQIISPSNSQHLKHFVQMPKSSQKLIILPTSGNTANSNIKPNIIMSSSNTTSPSLSNSIVSPLLIESGEITSQTPTLTTNTSNSNNHLRIISSVNNQATTPSSLPNPSNNTTNASQLNQLNALQASSVQKLILYKTSGGNKAVTGSGAQVEPINHNLMNNVNGTHNQLSNSNNQSQNMTNQTSTNPNKSLKILSTTPILSNQIITNSQLAISSPSSSSSPSSISKPILFNVSSGLKKNKLINKLTNSQQLISLAQTNVCPSVALTNPQENNSNMSQKLSEFEVLKPVNSQLDDKDENQIQKLTGKGQIIELASLLQTSYSASSSSTSEIIIQNNIDQGEIASDSEAASGQIKRKRSISFNTVAEVSQAKRIDAQNAPNLCDTHLQYIKETLANLNSNTSNPSIKLKQDQKLDLRVLCESIKEKLEKNGYENMDKLNKDLNKIKESCIDPNKTLSSAVPIQSQLTQQSQAPQISCFKFDDENRTAQPDSIEIDSSNTNKRIRLLNLNIAEKLVEEPSNESESRNEPAHNSEQADH